MTIGIGAPFSGVFGEEIPSRLRAKVIRRWPIVVGIAILFAILLPLLGRPDGYDVSAVVEFRPSIVSLETSKLRGDAFDPGVSLGDLAKRITSEESKASIQTLAGVTGTISASAPTALKGPFVVGVTAPSSAGALRILQIALDKLGTEYEADVRNQANRAISSLDKQKAVLDQRIVGLDSALAKSTDKTSNLAQSLIAERQIREGDLTDIDALRAAISSYVDGIATAIRVTNNPKPSRSSLPPFLALGTLLGLFVGLGVVVALAFFDRQLVTKSDLLRVGLADRFCGALLTGAGRTEWIDSAFTSSVAQAVDDSKSEVVRIVPLNSDADSRAVADLLTRHKNDFLVEEFGAFGKDASIFESSNGTALTLLLMPWGKSRDDEVLRAVSELRCDASAVIVAFTNVPKRRLNSVVTS